MRVRSLSREDLLEKEMATHSSILAGKFHGQRSLEGYCPRGCKELDMTERLTLLRIYIVASFPDDSDAHKSLKLANIP